MWTREMPLLLALTAVGVLIDSAMAASGLISFRPDEWISLTPLVPVWLICLWLMFATTIYHCLDWLNGRMLLAVLLAAVAGPLSYWAGAGLGAATLPDSPLSTLLAYAVIWAVLLPIALWGAARWRCRIG
jgi:hypothetical protein